MGCDCSALGRDSLEKARRSLHAMAI